ncbi:hypothetical protein JAAARDRAFT_661288 [Jaapia argillacea MUCL 33604]|uniref:Uncharacterized protein n=1 Tax=Jaapia argillacea MUCL 33604 TaxID=933084 RepID=A0A067PE90_9AGAM|nr:hypothetical protein JAAARDRAFT_661288 [Jaapia argillacea MUCL 33604]
MDDICLFFFPLSLPSLLATCGWDLRTCALRLIDSVQVFLRNIQTEIGRQLRFLQATVYAGAITDGDDDGIDSYFYDRPTAAPKQNKHIYPSNKPGRGLKIMDLGKVFGSDGGMEGGRFVYPENSDFIPVTADLDSNDGLLLVKEALESVTPESLTRIGFIHNPQDASPPPHQIDQMDSSLKSFLTPFCTSSHRRGFSAS